MSRSKRMAMAAAVAATLACPSISTAQTTMPARWTPQISAGAGLGHVFRFEDQTFGDRPNLSAGVAVLHATGFGVEIEFNRTLGLSPEPAPCGIQIDDAPAPCFGRARNGVESAAIVSLSARYDFTIGRLRPYVTAGIGVLHTRSVWSTAFVDDGQVVLVEQGLIDTGMGPDLGAGLRIDLTPRVSIGPEVRWLDASARSRLNLAVTRLSVRAAYSW